MKRCSGCGITKDLSEFHKNKAAIDGHRHCCKSCVKSTAIEYRKHLNYGSEKTKDELDEKRKLAAKNRIKRLEVAACSERPTQLGYGRGKYITLLIAETDAFLGIKDK